MFVFCFFFHPVRLAWKKKGTFRNFVLFVARTAISLRELDNNEKRHYVRKLGFFFFLASCEFLSRSKTEVLCYNDDYYYDIYLAFSPSRGMHVLLSVLLKSILLSKEKWIKMTAWFNTFKEYWNNASKCPFFFFFFASSLIINIDKNLTEASCRVVNACNYRPCFFIFGPSLSLSLSLKFLSTFWWGLLYISDNRRFMKCWVAMTSYSQRGPPKPERNDWSLSLSVVIFLLANSYDTSWKCSPLYPCSFIEGEEKKTSFFSFVVASFIYLHFFFWCSFPTAPEYSSITIAFKVWLL